MTRIISLMFAGLLALLAPLASQAATEVRLQHAGLTLNALLEKVEGNWPEGPVILMTHGTLAHNAMEIMSTFQSLLKEQGISSLAINLSLGVDDRHGMYDCATPHTHRHVDALDEIGAWRSWLSRQGVTELVLLGHSRGGNQTAWYAAERGGDQLRAVVLVAPMTWNEKAAAQDYESRYGQALAPLLAEAQARLSEPGDNWMRPPGFIYCEQPQVSAAAFLGYYAADTRRDTPGLVAAISAPVRVFAGSEDSTLPDLVERMTPVMDGEHASMTVIQGADHFFRDLNADEVVEGIVEFINGL